MLDVGLLVLRADIALTLPILSAACKQFDTDIWAFSATKAPDDTPTLQSRASPVFYVRQGHAAAFRTFCIVAVEQPTRLAASRTERSAHSLMRARSTPSTGRPNRLP